VLPERLVGAVTTPSVQGEGRNEDLKTAEYKTKPLRSWRLATYSGNSLYVVSKSEFFL
jgi:hypothetical protein